MSAFIDGPRKAPPTRTRKANLGTPDDDAIFATFDSRIIRRFLAYLKPHRLLVFGAQAAVLVSSLASVGIPWAIGLAVNAAVAHDVPRLESRLFPLRRHGASRRRRPASSTTG